MTRRRRGKAPSKAAKRRAGRAAFEAAIEAAWASAPKAWVVLDERGMRIEYGDALAQPSLDAWP